MNLTSIIQYVVMPLLSLALVFAFIRLVRGPSLPDRVIATEVIAAVAIGMFGSYAVMTGDSTYFDIGMVLALISFLGTAAVAQYIERRVRR